MNHTKTTPSYTPQGCKHVLPNSTTCANNIFDNHVQTCLTTIYKPQVDNHVETTSTSTIASANHKHNHLQMTTTSTNHTSLNKSQTHPHATGTCTNHRYIHNLLHTTETTTQTTGKNRQHIQVESSTNCLSSCWLFRLAFSFLQVSTKLWALLRMWVRRSNFWHRSENVIYSTWEPTNQRARFDPHENQPIRECDLFSLRIDQSQHQSVEIELFMMQNFTYFSRGLLYAALHLAPHQPLRFSFQLPGWEKKI